MIPSATRCCCSAVNVGNIGGTDNPDDVARFNTVGLTIGGTPLLDGVGKIVIMACMFLGRVGPLTLFMLLADRQADGRVRLPEEDVSTG